MLEYNGIQVELTNACNLKCVECPHRFMSRSVLSMSEDIFDRVLNEFVVGKKIQYMTLHKDGEPLLHSKLKHFISKICSVSDCNIDIYTNGLLITENFLGFLSEAKNKSRLLISFHFYNYDGSKNDYTKLTRLLKNVLQTPMPKIEFIVTTHVTKLVSKKELNDWKMFWTAFKSSNPITGIHVNKDINPWAGKIADGNTIYTSCAERGNALFIGNTGNVLACCTDLDEEIIFGNIMTDSIPEIMNLREIFYEDVKSHIFNHPICQRCVK